MLGVELLINGKASGCLTSRWSRPGMSGEISLKFIPWLLSSSLLGILDAYSKISKSRGRQVIMSYPVKRRLPEIRDYRARRYIQRLAEFLGEDEIERRLTRLALQLESESGFYLQEWGPIKEIPGGSEFVGKI